MSNKRFIQAFEAGAAITGRRIVKHDSSDGKAIQAAAATDKIIGVADSLDKTSGETVDVVFTGIAEVEAGGTIARGDLVTANASGQAVVAAPAAATNNRVVGIAMVSAVSGDYFDVLVQPHQIQG